MAQYNIVRNSLFTSNTSDGIGTRSLNNLELTSLINGNEADVARAVREGKNVAVVFDRLPEQYMGRRVVDADDHDLRFLDPKNTIAGLKAKGRARKDTTGFVRRTIPIQSV